MRLMKSGKAVGIFDLYASVKSSEALLVETLRQRERRQPERWQLADMEITEEVRWRSEEHAAREARLEFRRRVAELEESELLLAARTAPAYSGGCIAEALAAACVAAGAGAPRVDAPSSREDARSSREDARSSREDVLSSRSGASPCSPRARARLLAARLLADGSLAASAAAALCRVLEAGYGV